MSLQQIPPEQVPAEIAVFILAEFIKRPTADFHQPAKAMSQRGAFVTPAQIETLFAQHEIKKKM